MTNPVASEMLDSATKRPRGTAWLATAGLAGAIAASTCCVLPLLFVLAGVTGAWIGNLTALAPYQPLFLAFGAVCIGIGFWRAYRSESAVCEGPACGTPASRRLTRAVLWIAGALLLVSATTPWWATLFA